ncbi:MAG: amidase [Acidobacteria bacterium]|nr:MAG: amidase [Acidobacteriota bacterium]
MDEERPVTRRTGEGAEGAVTGRRRFLSTLALAGAGSAVFARALVAAAAGRKVTAEMVREAEWVAGVSFTDEERALMLEDLAEREADLALLRAVAIDNSVPPALWFRPLELGPPVPSPAPPRPADVPAEPPAARPASAEDLAYAPLATLAALLSGRKLSAVELLEASLARIESLDPRLLSVVTLLPERARAAARRADAELSRGGRRGALHGIPWGAKDLLAVPGAPTTWGSPLFRTRARPETATVVRRLDEAGAVLVAKTSVGELAWGDVWFGGTTKNPWKPSQGSSGSSAGSAAGVAAGFFPFAIGTETWGSVISPATRCGVTGLRPTFGRVSRHGVMALSWSLDKVGVLARTAADCAVVLSAIHGADLLDPSSVSRAFEWPAQRRLSDLTVGYVAELFEDPREKPGEKPGEKAPTAEERARRAEQLAFDRRTLETLRSLGVELVPVEMPRRTPVGPLSLVLTAEASAAFDDLVRDGRVREMVRQVRDAWPNVFRQGELVSAVDYLRASRARTLLMREMEEKLRGVDAFVAPTFGGDVLLLTNLTGHPAVVVPNGFRAADGTPTSITFTGRLFGEADLLLLASAYQEATDFHRKRPPLRPEGGPKG